MSLYVGDRIHEIAMKQIDWTNYIPTFNVVQLMLILIHIVFEPAQICLEWVLIFTDLPVRYLIAIFKKKLSRKGGLEQPSGMALKYKHWYVAPRVCASVTTIEPKLNVFAFHNTYS